MSNPFLTALADADGAGVDPGALEELLFELTDADLNVIEAGVRDERHRRALGHGDLGAIGDEAFAKLFDSRGMPGVPYVHDGLLVVGGSKVARSQMSHKCEFATSGDAWVWESPDAVWDAMRPVGDNHGSVRTVTILAAGEGLVVDVISCKFRSGTHTREQIRSYAVADGRVVQVPTRGTPRIDGHR